MTRIRFGSLAAIVTVAGAAMVFPFEKANAEGIPASVNRCPGPAELIRLDNPLPRTAMKLAAGQPLTIIAVGSSSTFGAGASSPDKSYPSRLEAELKAMYPRVAIKVLNRGVNGEDVRDMVARFNRDVFAENPDLVLWQVGSNSVLRDQPIQIASETLRLGLKRLRSADTDVVLINPQYAPKVIAKADSDKMVDLIDATARETRVDLFQRFALMRYWRLTEEIPFSTFVSSDELHMNDWSYGCVAKLLARAIVEAATRSTVTAKAVSAR